MTEAKPKSEEKVVCQDKATCPFEKECNGGWDSIEPQTGRLCRDAMSRNFARVKYELPEPAPRVPSRGELLEHYASKPVTEFIQLDGFLDVRGDDVMRPDKDGDECFGGRVHELMSGGTNVRVLIIPKTSTTDALRLLGKIVEWLKREPGLLRQQESRGNRDDLPF